MCRNLFSLEVKKQMGKGFDYPLQGPFGKCLQTQLNMTFNENVAFSDKSWQNARQNCQYGCVLPPGLPQWPASQAVTRPSVSDVQLINTLQAKPFALDSPYIERPDVQAHIQAVAPKLISEASPLAPSSSPIAQSLESAIHKAAATSPNIASLSLQSAMQAFKGLVYDLKNWKQLPGNTPLQKLTFMATYDKNRAVSISLSVLLLLAIIAFIVLLSVFGCCCDK
jgi:hypothetical protein